MLTNADQQGLLTVGLRDKRITKVGYFLRNNKLDELPQLFNVLIGNMSMVGPRPEVRKYVEIYTPEQKEILKIKPGITDFASIKYSNENELLGKSENPEKTYIEEIMPAKIELNMIYLNNQSSIKYLQILCSTLIRVLFKSIRTS
jgi:lipopolysaccharide/colanic/teichoic acid biosynthesis glycosyltransferase